jgi:hypothetical protein
VASGELGNFVVVWQRHAGGSEAWDVVARLYDRTGSPLGAEFLVNATTAGCQQRPSVAADRAGNFVVVWQSEGQDGSGWGVFGRRFASDGTALGGEFPVNVTTAGAQQAPVVARHPDGSFLVAWQSEASQPDSTSWDVFGRGFDPSGVPASPEFLVNATTAGAQSGPRIAYLHGSPSRYAIVWQSQGQDGSGAGVYRRIFSLEGTAQSPEQAASSSNGSQAHPTVAADASGNFSVAWESPEALYSRRFNLASNPLAGEVPIVAGLPGEGHHPAVAGNGSGDFLVAWERANGDADGSAIFARLFDHRQLPRGPEFRVSSTETGDQTGAAAASSPGGNVMVAWSSTPPAAADTGVLAQRNGIPGMGFHTLIPCRVVDTRNPAGPFGGPALSASVQRTFTIAASACGVPISARALSLNLTATGSTSSGFLAIYPGDTVFPMTSSVSFAAGQTRANNAVAALSRDGLATLTARAGVAAGTAVHLILDVNGYFE